MIIFQRGLSFNLWILHFNQLYMHAWLITHYLLQVIFYLYWSCGLSESSRETEYSELLSFLFHYQLSISLTLHPVVMKSQLLSKVFFLPLHCCLRMTTMNLSDIPFSSERCFIEFRSRLCQSSTPNSLINVYMDLALCTGSSHVGTGRASHKLFPQRALNCTKYLGMLKR